VGLDTGTRLGPYEILAPLGAGGMGEVYRARDTRLDRQVAVKVLPADSVSSSALERFEREAKAIAALNHPGICAVYDVGTSPVPFLVMELLEGETLHQRVARGRFEVPALLDIGLALADALASAHAKGIVHRDLKPANIVLTPRGPKILDFGLERFHETVAQSDTDITAFPTLSGHGPLTDAGVTVGTVAYMSPEQLRGEAIDARTDLFSLGLVLYEMATGRRAFSGTTSAVTSAAILHEQPPAPRELQPDLPARFEQAILTLLEKDREVRTQTASELRAELTRLKRELTGSRTPDTATPSLPTADASRSSAAPTSTVTAPPSSSDAQLIAGVMRRHRGLVVGVAALIVIAIAGAAYVFAPRAGNAASPSTTSALSIADLQVEPLTTSGTADRPAISPDGNYVVYVENGGGQQSLRVRQVATGSNVEIVPGEPGVGLMGATVTPDGAFVNYVRRVGQQQSPELWQIPFLGGSPHRLLPGIGGRVSFSPDGNQDGFQQTAVSLPRSIPLDPRVRSFACGPWMTRTARVRSPPRAPGKAEQRSPRMGARSCSHRSTTRTSPPSQCAISRLARHRKLSRYWGRWGAGCRTTGRSHTLILELSRTSGFSRSTAGRLDSSRTSPLTDRRSGTSTGPRMASGSLWPAHEWRATSCCSVD